MSDARNGREANMARSVDTLRHDYDWDGAIAPCCAEIDELIAPQRERVAEAFWRHFRTLPASAAIRDTIEDPAAIAQRVEHG